MQETIADLVANVRQMSPGVTVQHTIAEDSDQDSDDVQSPTATESQIKIDRLFPEKWRIVEHFNSKLVKDVFKYHGVLAAVFNVKLEM